MMGNPSGKIGDFATSPYRGGKEYSRLFPLKGEMSALLTRGYL